MAARLRNEQAPVVAGVLAMLRGCPKGLLEMEHAPVLERLSSDAEAAEDCICRLWLARTLAPGILQWRLRSLCVGKLAGNELVRWALGHMQR